MDLKVVDSKDGYYNFIQGYGDSLIRWWANQTQNPDHYLQYGPALKMVNLLIKWNQESEYFKQHDKLKFQHVPFDSFSLQPLKNIINQLTDTKFKIVIQSNASMGIINTPQLYKVIMDCIYKLTELSNIHPIAYDYWCWEEKHEKHYFE